VVRRADGIAMLVGKHGGQDSVFKIVAQVRGDVANLIDLVAIDADEVKRTLCVLSDIVEPEKNAFCIEPTAFLHFCSIVLSIHGEDSAVQFLFCPGARSTPMKSQSTTIRLAPSNSLFAFVRQFALTLLVIGNVSAVPALGSPGGELDPQFGEHGRILLRDARFEELRGVDVFVDPDSGKLLTVVSGYYGNALVRFNSDGSLDQGFGDRGAVRLEFDDYRVEIYDAKLLPDGKLLLAGTTNVYGDPDKVIHGTSYLARINADGTPDVSFGSNGRVMLQLGGVYESFSEILPQPDGRIVALGASNFAGRTQRILAGYSQDGLPDSRFGSGNTPGVAVIELNGLNGALVAVVQQGDGKFMACGNAMAATGTATAMGALAVSLRADGSRDTTYGINGAALIGIGQDNFETQTCLTLADGHLAIAGTLGSGDMARAAALRLTPDGSLDTGFGDNGMVLLPTEWPSSAHALLVMSDGSLAIAGTLQNPNSDGWYSWIDMLVTRIDPTSGEIDRAFGDRGFTAVDFGTRGHSGIAVPVSFVQQPDGKLLAIGTQFDIYDWYYATSIAIMRIDPYGSGSNGWAGMSDTFATVPSSGGEAVFRIRRTGGDTGQLSVDYRTLDGTATAETDYAATMGTLVWPDGDMGDRTLSIAVLNAQPATDNKYFSVELFNSSGGLAMDLATVAITNKRSSNATPVPTGGSNNGSGIMGDKGSGISGGGAIGIELWFLMVLVAIGVVQRSRRMGGIIRRQ